MSPLKLDALPVEIIKRIASCLPCESLLCLMQVNGSLHAITNDDLIFKAIIQNGNGKHFASSCPVSPLTMSVLSVLPELNWRRFALADSKLRDWISRLGPSNEAGEVDDVKSWLPQLAALNHPFLTEMDLYELGAGLGDLVYGGSSYAAVRMVKFVMTAAILHREGPESLQNIAMIQNTLVQSQPNAAVSHFPITGSFAWAILNNLHRFRHRILLPSPARMPLWSLMSLPPPFSKLSTDENYLEMMTSPSFLEDGEWVGYYSLGIDFNTNNEIDPPMHGINFTVTPHPFGGTDPVAIRSEGIDNVGQFTLTGIVYRNGRIGITKLYSAGFAWEWNGTMTPFGIVGEWGSHGTNFGHVWLWKREWCRLPKNDGLVGVE